MTEVQLGYKLNDFLFSTDFNSAKTDEDVLSNAVSLEVVDTNNSSIENNEIGKIKLFFDVDTNYKKPTYYKWTIIDNDNSEGKWEVASSYKPKIENGVISLFKYQDNINYYKWNGTAWINVETSDISGNTIFNQYKSKKLIEITQEHSGSDERFQNTLDQYRKAYLDNINITLGIVGLGILIFYHYK
jgi:hypothetical protein|tara:strand:+ start:4085 stop:4645 length:561 start_codon:yes stop_codon:yes gene_type:complete